MTASVTCLALLVWVCVQLPVGVGIEAVSTVFLFDNKLVYEPGFLIKNSKPLLIIVVF